MNKKKICHIITKLELGGAQNNTLYTVEHLNKDKYDVILITGSGGVLDSKALQLKKVKVYFINELIREISIMNDIKAFFKLLNILAAEKPDIVHTHSSKAGILGRIAAFFARVSFIIHTYHGFGFHDFQKPAVKRMYILIEKIVSIITYKFIAVSSQNIYKGLENNLGTQEKYTLIRSGIDTELFRNTKIDRTKKMNQINIPVKNKIVTTIGPFKPQKNLSDFVMVAANVIKSCPDTTFLIIGDGEGRRNLKALISGLSMERSILIPGWRSDINEILAITDVFVMTSLWEGLPRSILEAMCSSLPVVANSIDGIKEIVRNNETGFLLEPHFTDKMSEQIVKLLKDEKLAKTMGIRGNAAIDKQFDINFMIKQQEELYDKLLFDKTY